jgi:AcrR family transcriptional regulator
VEPSHGALRVVDVDAPASGPSAVPGTGTGSTSDSPHRIRIIDGTLACLARHGTVKTTVDDIARQSGVSRATVYRAFPGGRDEILGAVVDTEVARLFSDLGVRLGSAEDLADALVVGIVTASSRLRDHDALHFLVEHEPGIILGHLAFADSDRLLATSSRFTAPFLARWMPPAEAERVAEWAARIVLSYAISPSDRTDPCDPVHARRIVERFMLPGIDALQSAGSAPIDISPFPSTEPGDGPPAAPDLT